MSDNNEKSAVELMQDGLAELDPNAIEEVVEEPVQEPTEVELKAKDMGWTPKESYKGDPLEFVDADEFIRRKPLFDKIHHEVKARKKIEQQLNEVTDYVKKITDKEYTKRLAELRAKRQLAIEEQDIEAADAVNEDIVNLTTERKTQELKSEQEVAADNEAIKQQNQVVLSDWMTNNPWYNTSPELRAAADAEAVKFSQKYPNEPLTELLDYVDGKMQKKLPKEVAQDEDIDIEEDDQPPKKLSAVSKVAVGKQTTRRPPAKPKYTRASLDPMQRQIMDTFVQRGILTEQEYIDSLVATGEVA